MEVELQKESYPCYQAAPEIVDTHEESTETIIPDYCPDIARIVDANACLLLHGAELLNGKATLSGSIEITLLYMADDAQGLRKMDYSIALQHTVERESLKDCSNLSLEGHVCAPEVRLLNPRKIFTRIDVEIRATPYAAQTLCVCSGVAQQSAYHMETLCETHEASLLRGIREKGFTVSDEIPIPGGKAAIHQLLSVSAKPRLTDCKAVGNKVMLKGVACVSMLYATESGAPEHCAMEMSFSQIVDGLDAADSDVSAEALLRTTEFEAHSDGEGRTLSVSLALHAFVILRQSVSLRCIADLYSTSHEVNAESELLELSRPPVCSVRQQNVREQIDTSVEIGSILCAEACLGSPSLTRSGDSFVLRTVATIKVLYLDENGVPLLAERRSEITLDSDAEAGDPISVSGVCSDDITTGINAQGIEVRFPVIFRITSAPRLRCVWITALQAQERTDNGETAPSLTLRALQPDQTLWDLAKQCRTTVEEIVSANELGEKTAAVGELLLIPRKR